MKKKLFGYLTLAFAIMSIGLVGSCRDYDEDVFRVKQELKDADSDLYDTIISRYNMAFDSIRSRYKVLMDSIDTLADRQERCRINCNTRFDSVFRTLDTIKGRIDTLDMRVDSLKDTLYYRTDSLRKDVDSLYSKTEYILSKIDTIIWKMDTLSKRIDTVNLRVDTVNLRVDTLDLRIDTLDLRIDTLKLRIDTVFMSIDTLRRRVDTLYMSIDTIKRRLDTLGWRIDTLKLRIDTLEMRVDTLEHRVDSLFDAEKKRITSLYVQGALNPTFGYFALPGGIKNNILMGYYGEAAYDAEFPAIDGTSPSSALIYDTPSAYMLSATEAANIGTVTPISLAAGDVIPANNDTVALGKIYLTVNPNEVEIDSTYTFKFVNSIGEESKATIGELTHSSDKLQFGFRTRGASTDSTGFYEAPVTVLANDVESIKPEISVDPAQLKAVVKKLMNKQIDLGGIAGAVFDLFQTKLDAQAVKTTWTDSLGTHNITSYYDVAATAVKPLSFSAMNGMGAGISIPTISPIGDLSTFVPTFVMPDLGDFDITGVTITIPSITFTSLGNVIVEFSNPSLGTQSADLTDLGTKLAGELAGFTDATQTEINSEINAMIAQINLWVTNKLNKIEINMDAGVNGMLDDLKNNINSAFSGYISKLNSITGRINSMINRLNSVLSTSGAGAILQPILVYEGVDGNMHPVSNDAAHPSVANGAVGKQMILYPTSYSAELLAPAYKKYIAIVDVTDGGTMTTSTNSNCGSYFNQVIDGGRYGIDFKPEAAGTYVIYYSAIDYNGRIAANRFYIKVQ
ncbi:MAG: hypothetical protein KBT49_07725 [Bacteroidetes bacterium]|nr:hypothetical protein [Candidatus Colenecus caballi]